MRRIWFKAKNLNENKWVKGSLLKTPFGTFIEWYNNSICNKEKVYSHTVCQFTGLTDCENNAIYEGDIIRNPEFPFEKRTVIWDNNSSCFALVDIDGCKDRDLSLSVLFDKWIVIGNKFGDEK